MNRLETYFEDVQEGDAAPEWSLAEPLERQHFVRYAGASGDFNPLHYDDGFATRVGFPSVIAQGMFTAGVLATFLTNWVGEENVRRFRTRFVGQVWPGEQITCKATVTSVGEGSAEVALLVENEKGEKKIDGDARVVLGGS